MADEEIDRELYGLKDKITRCVVEIEAIRRELTTYGKIHIREIDTAKKELDRRLESMNGLKKQLDEQARSFVSRTEIDFRIGALDKAISDIRTILDRNVGSAKWSDHLITAVIAMAVVIGAWVILNLFGISH